MRCWQNWVRDDDSWLPVVVSYLLPESGQAGWRTDITQRHQVAAMSTDQDDDWMIIGMIKATSRQSTRSARRERTATSGAIPWIGKCTTVLSGVSAARATPQNGKEINP